MKFKFPEQEKAKLMRHSMCPGVQNDVSVDDQGIQIYEKKSFTC